LVLRESIRMVDDRVDVEGHGGERRQAAECGQHLGLIVGLPHPPGRSGPRLPPELPEDAFLLE